MKRKSNGGFTLVELVVILTVLAILIGIVLPSFTGYIKKQRESAVIADGGLAYDAAHNLAVEAYTGGWNANPSNEDILKLAGVSGEIIAIAFDSTTATVKATETEPFKYKENGIVAKYVNGEWSIDAEGGASGGGEGGEGGGEVPEPTVNTENPTPTPEPTDAPTIAPEPTNAPAVYPHTPPGYPQIMLQPASEAWPDAEDCPSDNSGFYWPESGTLRGIFIYDNEYYIVARAFDTSNNKMSYDVAASGPGGTAYGQWNTEKLTRRVITDWNEMPGKDQWSNKRKDMSRGDIVYFNDSYYVYNDSGVWADPPMTGKEKWYKIPSEYYLSN